MLNSPREMVIAGQRFKARQNDLQDLADFEEHIRSQHVGNFLKNLDSMPVRLDSATISSTIAQLYSHVLDIDEKINLSRSLVGVRFFLIRAIQKCNPEIVEGDVCPLVTLENLQDVINMLDEFNLPTEPNEIPVKGETAENPTPMETETKTKRTD